jgi:hypothetical protein
MVAQREERMLSEHTQRNAVRRQSLRTAFGGWKLGKSNSITLIVAGTARSTAGAVAAAGGLSLFFIAHHTADNQGNRCQQEQADENCTDIRADPLQHKNHSISEH